MRLVEVEMTDHLSRVVTELMSARRKYSGSEVEVVRVALAPSKVTYRFAEYPVTADIRMEVAEIWRKPMYMLPPWIEQSDIMDDLVELYRVRIDDAELWFCPSLHRVYRAAGSD